MGMACDAEGSQAALPDAPERPAGAAAAGGMNAEETAMILTSLSKCQFGDGPRASMTATSAATATTTRVTAGGGSSSGDSDLEGFSDDEQSPHFRGRVSRVQQINFDGPEGSKLDFTDEAGLSHRFRNESNRVKSMVTKHISIDELRAHFDRPIIDVAKDFGICITLMKKICRRNGIKRWPHRQIRSLSKSIASMEAAMLSAHGGERDKYRDQIQNLRLKRESVIADPNKDSAGKGDAAMSAGDLPLYHAPATSLRPHHHVSAAPKLSPRPTASSPGAMAFKTENGGVPPHSKGGRWTSDEHAAFLEGIRLYGKDWRRVAQVVRTRSAVQTRTHAQKYLLKFAGRFPFDGPDGTGAGLTSSAPSGGRQSDDVTMLSPTETSASTVMTTPASDDSASSSGSWNADEASVKPVSEAMAMILNTSPALQPEAEPEPEEEPTPRYPRALELEMGPSKVASASAL